MTNSSNRKGFSLIELILVIVIVGLLAAIGIPSLSKSRDAAEKGTVVGTLRTMLDNQKAYMAQNRRYARLNELNTFSQNTLGSTSGSRIYRGNYMYLMLPNPTNITLRTHFQIIAYRIEGGVNIPTFSIKENGVIEAIVP
jgi:prepilin-type N-terminal cleavage/methylation domain-containing protein